jgi:hypothetical protein
MFDMKQLFIMLIIGILAGCYGTEPEKTGKEGKPIPSFKILLADSVTNFDTKDIPVGKPSVMFYYGPYCPYSRAQMAEMIEEMSSMKDIQFFVFTSFPFLQMKTFDSLYQLHKYRNVISGVDSAGFFMNYFKIAGVPFTAIYGKDKKLIKAFQGKIYSKQIIKALDEE